MTDDLSSASHPTHLFPSPAPAWETLHLQVAATAQNVLPFLKEGASPYAAGCYGYLDKRKRSERHTREVPDIDSAGEQFKCTS